MSDNTSVVLCGCGAAAATELQVGWDADLNGGAGGGLYEPLCDRCHAQTPDGLRHAAAYGETVEEIHLGLWLPDPDGRVWRCGVRSMSAEDYERLRDRPYDYDRGQQTWRDRAPML